MGKLELQQMVLGPVYTNCYFLKNKETGETLIVDPADSPKRIFQKVEDMGAKPVGILLTHGHFDHIMGIEDFLKAFDVPVYVGREEQPLLADDRLNASSMYGYHCTYTGAKALEDGQTVECAGTEIHVIHTPGHTVGGCCYYLPEVEALFCGDTLFCGSIGRTDLPTGSSRDLAHSIREKLMILPDETKLYPGHMDESTIGYEKEINPFI